MSFYSLYASGLTVRCALPGGPVCELYMVPSSVPLGGPVCELLWLHVFMVLFGRSLRVAPPRRTPEGQYIYANLYGYLLFLSACRWAGQYWSLGG